VKGFGNFICDEHGLYRCTTCAEIEQLRQDKEFFIQEVERLEKIIKDYDERLKNTIKQFYKEEEENERLREENKVIENLKNEAVNENEQLLNKLERLWEENERLKEVCRDSGRLIEKDCKQILIEDHDYPEGDC
jgi:predicted RNase H-like nuclease (RuvC/YqgF family)